MILSIDGKLITDNDMTNLSSFSHCLMEISMNFYQHFLSTIQYLAAIALKLALKLLQLLSLPIRSKLAQVESLLSILNPDFEGQQQHHYQQKISAKGTALTLGKISTKIMRSGAIWSHLFQMKTALLNKNSEFGNPLTSNSLFTGKFQKILTKPYVYQNKNLA